MVQSRTIQHMAVAAVQSGGVMMLGAVGWCHDTLLLCGLAHHTTARLACGGAHRSGRGGGANVAGGGLHCVGLSLNRHSGRHLMEGREGRRLMRWHGRGASDARLWSVRCQSQATEACVIVARQAHHSTWQQAGCAMPLCAHLLSVAGTSGAHAHASGAHARSWHGADALVGPRGAVPGKMRRCLASLLRLACNHAYAGCRLASLLGIVRHAPLGCGCIGLQAPPTSPTDG